MAWAQREIQALADAGYREVTLLGQNIDAYGRDLPGFAEDGSGRRTHTLTDLLHHIHDVQGIERIRFATSHPRSVWPHSAQLGLLPSKLGTSATSRLAKEDCGLPSFQRQAAQPNWMTALWLLCLESCTQVCRISCSRATKPSCITAWSVSGTSIGWLWPDLQVRPTAVPQLLRMAVHLRWCEGGVPWL